jgi:beta-galactosidase
MLFNRMLPICISCFLFIITTKGFAQQKGRQEKDLSQNNWKLWLDTAATWENDSLYTPPVDIRQLPVHEPTGGWSRLSREQSAKGHTVHLPATVEEYCWGRNGNAFGVAGTGFFLAAQYFYSSR